MKRSLKLQLVSATLVLVAIFTPLRLAMAQEESPTYVFPIAGGEYGVNETRLLGQVGNGEMAVGAGETVNCNQLFGDLDRKIEEYPDDGYYTLENFRGKNITATGACDVCSWIRYVLVQEGFESLSWVEHPDLSGIPVGWSVSIVRYNGDHLQTGTWVDRPGEQNAWMRNDGELVILRWTVSAETVTFWVTRTGENPNPPASEQTPPPPSETTLPTTVETVEQGESPDPFRIWLEKSKILDYAMKLGVVDEKLVFWVKWGVIGVVGFVLLFVYLLLQRWVDKQGNRTELVLAGRLWFKVERPRGYFQKAYWALAIILPFVFRSSTDYVFKTVGMQMWGIWLVLTAVFFVLRRADIGRIRDERPRSRLWGWIHDWIIGGMVLCVAAYCWGNTIGLMFYAFGASGDGGQRPSLRYVAPAPQWQTPLKDIPSRFKETVKEYADEVIQIAFEEGVPPEVPFVLWMKEHSGTQTNPGNGEGICGFHDLVVSGQETFPPGPIDHKETLRQLRLCAQEFKRRSGDSVSFTTTDLSVLGPVYMRYNGNLSCYGGKFKDWTYHPYVMNGWDDAHLNMVARTGDPDMPCIALKVIGAIPAHVRIGVYLRSLAEKVPTPTPTPKPNPDAPTCIDPNAFCGFALPGKPNDYILGAISIDGLGFHCNLANECGWDWWKPGHLSSSEDPTDVLSMLNGEVTKIGVYKNKTPYIEVTNQSGRRQWAYHCDKYYVAVGDPVVWGQPICLMGDKGDSDWTHLHLVLQDVDGSSIFDQTQWVP